jgi:hypothetical protein
MTVAAVLCIWGAVTSSALGAAPTIVAKSTAASEVTTTTVVLEAEVNPQGKPTAYQFLYGTADCSVTPAACAKAPLPKGNIPTGTSPAPVKVPVTGLSPATVYHFLIEAENTDGKAKGPGRVFATYAAPLAGLPDGRAYEQASPVNKNGGDAVGERPLVKAALGGGGITFGSSFGIPGGVGAGALPTYLASRGANWSTQGLFPSLEVGQRDKLLGWLPDLTEAFTQATKLGNPRTDALIGRSTVDGTTTVIGPYAPKAAYAYAGASAGASTILFEARAKLPSKVGGPTIEAAAGEGAPNVYAWERGGEVHLAGVFNDGKAPPKGSLAGPYDWTLGTSAINLREGGGRRSYYLQDTHAIAADGSVYFTAGGTGQLYLRLHPTAAQSPLDGGGKCTNPALACTIHVSASHRTKPDTAGEQPAAFQAASPDGSEVFFTSSEMLTDDAYTGKEQPVATISRTGIGGGNPVEIPDFIPKRAVGVTVAGSHIYWADPVAGAIGRADIDGHSASVDPNFIAVPESEGECEEEVEVGNDTEFVPVSIPASPRYLALANGFIYWTNTGRRGSEGVPVDGGGTIGRAKLVGETAEEVDPAFICGEDKAEPGKRMVSNPQGIAVNESHIYWANAAPERELFHSIGRATVGGGEVKGACVQTIGQRTPYGVALSSTHVYFTGNEEFNNNGFVSRAPLGCGTEEAHLFGEEGFRGLALDAGHVYWASQREGTIGRVDLELETPEKAFIKTEGQVNGLAVDAAHIYWSVNGDAATNPGNDLYRFEPATGTLSDLTADHLEADKAAGAAVQGLVAASDDGSYLYFAANGNLDGAEPGGGGSCKGPVKRGSGKCALYLLHDGTTSFVAPLAVEGGNPDSLNWVGTPFEAFNNGSYFPKTAFLAADGRTLLFQSHAKLSDYDNEGVPELYRYRPGDAAGIRCVSCRPSGEAVGAGPSLGSIGFPGAAPPSAVAGVSSRILSADGEHAFFETTEALSPTDINGQGGCPPSGPRSFPSCLDVYEWEAPGIGSCKEDGPSYSPLNEGCLFLISPGKERVPSLFADASASGEDVFFFTRQRLVGQDEDELQDVYDARVGGGLPSQNPPPPNPCPSAEACHGPAQEAPAESSPGSANFSGPENPKPKHGKSTPHKKQGKKKKQSAKSKKEKHKKHKRVTIKGGDSR